MQAKSVHNAISCIGGLLAAYPSSDEPFTCLHAAGWSIGDVRVMTAAGPCWGVIGANGKNIIEPDGKTQADVAGADQLPKPGDCQKDARQEYAAGAAPGAGVVPPKSPGLWTKKGLARLRQLDLPTASRQLQAGSTQLH
jgi:hypothetical protein